MIEPKQFYRELDAVLSTINKEKSDEGFFVTILNVLEEKFGEVLQIRDSHVYEQRGDDFVFLDTSPQQQDSAIARSIPVQSQGIQQVMKKGVVVFDQPGLLEGFDLKIDFESITVAAIVVQNPVRKWLLVFEIEKGRVREDVMLFLNAVQTAINYRLFSEMMQNDLKRAEEIQKSLLPKQAPKVAGYQIYGHSQPAELVGGDFFDFFQFSDEDFGGCIGDASGHGLPAALLVRDVVVGLRMGLAKEMRLVHTLNKLNHVIQQSTYATNFVSIFVGEIESEGHLFYVNAGHPPPFLVSGKSIQDLSATGITLGFLPDINLRRSYIWMPPESVLVLFSDGIIERHRNVNVEDQYGIDRLKKLVTENRRLSAKEIVQLVFKKVYEFAKRTPWDDDATLVVVKRLAEE